MKTVPPLVDVMTAEARFLNAIYLLNAHEAGPFHKRLFAAVRLLFPDTVHTFDLWRTTDGVYETHMDFQYPGSDHAAVLEQVGVLVPREHPVYAYIADGGKEAMRLSDFTTHRQFASTELYEVGFKPSGIRDQLAFPIVTPTHVGGLAVNRIGRRPFSDEELALARSWSRFVAQAHHASEILREAEALRGEGLAVDEDLLRRAGLSRRESEVFQWMAQGKRDREIGIILGISHRTVNDHVCSILAKLGVESRMAAVTCLGRLPGRRMGKAEWSRKSGSSTDGLATGEGAD